MVRGVCEGKVNSMKWSDVYMRWCDVENEAVKGEGGLRL